MDRKEAANALEQRGGYTRLEYDAALRSETPESPSSFTRYFGK